jgi:hypothetical protein
VSAALTTSEAGVIREVRNALATLGSNYLAQFDRLEWKLLSLRHCDTCGVLFEGLPSADECQHCATERRYAEGQSDS